MIKIIGDRRSGKTTKLLKYAYDNGYVLVEPTMAMRDYVARMAKALGYDDVQIIAPWHMKQYISHDKGCKFVIDELDDFLAAMGVVAYSNTNDQ